MESIGQELRNAHVATSNSRSPNNEVFADKLRLSDDFRPSITDIAKEVSRPQTAPFGANQGVYQERIRRKGVRGEYATAYNGIGEIVDM